MDQRDLYSFGFDDSQLDEIRKKYFNTPMRAIRAKCRECSNFSDKEIRDCEITHCALWEYRSGKRKGRNLSDAQRKAIGERLQKARASNADKD